MAGDLQFRMLSDQCPSAEYKSLQGWIGSHWSQPEKSSALGRLFRQLEVQVAQPDRAEGDVPIYCNITPDKMDELANQVFKGHSAPLSRMLLDYRAQYSTALQGRVTPLSTSAGDMVTEVSNSSVEATPSTLPLTSDSESADGTELARQATLRDSTDTLLAAESQESETTGLRDRLPSTRKCITAAALLVAGLYFRSNISGAVSIARNAVGI